MWVLEGLEYCVPEPLTLKWVLAGLDYSEPAAKSGTWIGKDSYGKACTELTSNALRWHTGDMQGAGAVCLRWYHEFTNGRP